MACAECDAASSNPHCGLYQTACMDCCVRLLRSCRNLGKGARRAQEIAFEALEVHASIPWAVCPPTRADILTAMTEDG